MTTHRPAFEALTPALVGHTITLRSPTTQVTGVLTGIYVDGWTTSTYDGTTTVEDVNVSVRFDRHGDDWDVPVTSDMTLEIKEDDQ
ncbi:hypothetical protein [Micrococcus luteus]|uniref:hypothetical protein n=1 Tax=Micrococcus luteus TaxID=1270 RepID=UPI00230247E0|nr:hypothetical protein [Micrococcus luteus]